MKAERYKRKVNMTIKYAENLSLVSGLQADSRRDRGDRIDLVDQLLDKIRALPVKEKGVFDLQNYYYKTIARKTAFHGITGKVFSINDSDLELLVTWSQDCQYPLQCFLFDSGYIVGHIVTLKQTKLSYAKLNTITKQDLIDSIAFAIEKYNDNYQAIKYGLEVHVKSSHFRFFRNQCLNIIGKY